MEHVIFSIDNVNDTHTQAKFLRHIDTQRAMNKLKGKMVHCIGSWEGKLEPSYLMTWEDFQEHVIGMGFTENQDAILVIEGERMYSTLIYKDQSREYIGCMREVTASEAVRYAGFTYRPDLDKYWVVD